MHRSAVLAALMLASWRVSPKEFPWRRRIIAPVVAQLTQGATASKLALAIGAGLACGVFPFPGFTTALCFSVALVFRLNQPIIHLINQLLWPVQLVLIPAYIKAGGWLLGRTESAFDLAEARQLFLHSPAEFWSRFGGLGWQALVAWVVSAPLLVTGTYFIVRPVLERAASKSLPKT